MAIKQYYVSAATGDDTTGDGSIGNPWATIQKALNTIVKDTANGDQINIQSTMKQTLAAPLSLAVYGGPGAQGHLGLRGYTLTAGDGGMAEIDCNGATMWASTYSNISLAYLDCYNSGDNHLINLHQPTWIFHCRVHEVGGNDKCPITITGNSVIGCHVYNYSLGGQNTASGIQLGNGLIAYSRVEGGTNGYKGISSNLGHVIALGNFILLDLPTAIGIWGTSGNNLTALGNVVVNRASGTGRGIQGSLHTWYSSGPIMNNLVTGFSGVGGAAFYFGSGVAQVVGHNALWNNTTNYTGDNEIEQDLRANDVLLASDPFVNAAAGDFRLTDAAKALLRSAGWPPTYLDSTLDPHITIGAVQYGEAAGGGGGPVIGSRIIRGLGAV